MSGRNLSRSYRRMICSIPIQAMGKRTDEHSLGDLFREVDTHLRDAERLRNFVEQQQRTAFFPERRRKSRVPEAPERGDGNEK